MPKMLEALRRNLMGELEESHISDAIYRSQSVYLCRECRRYARPHSHYTEGPRFKHMTTAPNCSFSRKPAKKTEVG